MQERDLTQELKQIPVVPATADNRDVAAIRHLLDQIEREALVYVGERHDAYGDHLLQLAIIRGLHQRQRRPLAIGVEWLQRPFQDHVTDYIEARISESEMLERTQYFQRWGVDYRHYRPILQYARHHHIPLYALNAPSELTQAIGKRGINNLMPPLIELLPEEYFFTDQAYEQRLREVYNLHHGFPSSFENFYEVQLTWDETMAEEISRHLKVSPNGTLVVLAGNAHLAQRSGIPNRVERRSRIAGKVLLPRWPTLAENPADYLITTPNVTLPPAAALGIEVRDSKEGPRVITVADKGAGKRVGLRRGDHITKLNGQSLQNPSALRLALLDLQPGDQVQMEIRRGRQSPRQVQVSLQAAADNTSL
jgi:uncharacterized iron-regulated protein